MHPPQGQLSVDDHNRIPFWANDILSRFRDGKLSQIQATEEIAHLFAALDMGNIGEVQAAIRRHGRT